MGSFLTAAWYLAGWSDEVSGETMLSRRICDKPILLLRQADGTLAAMADRCPHRFAPLTAASGARQGARCRMGGGAL